MYHDWALGVSLLLTAFAAALGGIGLLMVLAGRRPARHALFGENAGGTVFLFDGETLIDASPAGRALLSAAPVRGTSWQRLMAFLAPRFPGFDARLANLPTEGRFVINSGDGNTYKALILMAEWRGGLARISLADPAGDGIGNLVDPLAQRAMEEELRLLRGTVAQAPLPIWLENAAGDVIWANTTYLTLATRRLGPDDELTWPLPSLTSVKASDRQRVRLDREGEPPAWFEATVRRAGDGRMIFALPADALVQAEQSLRDFTQTLTKTFAHLPIGLAIFDRQRQLALFNPALLDLTSLPPEFLIGRPTLFDFLDRLRDRQMIPEPKDYPSWRRRIVDLEEAAASGLYEETWNLPGGQTYRVLGRPHPDGAMALLFEDISTEMSRSRRYRADVELGQSVIDAMDEAVAVFSSAGMLVLSNATYSALWGHDPAGSVGADGGIAALASHWRTRTAPSPIWAEAEDFVVTLSERTRWSGEARLDDGRLIGCRFIPLGGGATMIAFRLALVDDGTISPFVSARSQLTA
jgi:PAS domain-containing protein